ncbi:MAG: MurR/RpiR family transcriptional regulator [Rhodobacteraceae bacterium]|nr:MurR/RpiR family transcriptional regulator [Paracoccaceae bacterium]
MTKRLHTHKMPGRVAVDVISNLRSAHERLSVRELLVADFVQKNLEKISTMTIAELANSCGVSTPTVVRFCRSMGCKGYREFKMLLAQNLAVSLQYLDMKNIERPQSDSEIVDQIMGALSATLNILRKQMDATTFATAKQMLVNARSILVGGVGGGSSMLAYEAANRLFRLGIPAVSVSDSYVLQMRAATLRSRDILLLISASGEADEMLCAADIARGYNATTLAITKRDSSLADRVDCAITADLPEDPDIHKPTASRYAYLVVVDALAMAVAQSRSKETTENLRRIRASLSAYHGRTGPQPLGD